MAVASTRSIGLAFTGDVTYNQTFSAASGATSPGEIQILDLSSGANTITPPTSATKACTLIPPAANTQTITLKGVTGDTGVVLHKTDPSSFGLNSGATTFCLTAGGIITGLRLIWS
tara:strand:- start:1244 stop:1591 length:348 start_codon:yes stop_codon:yes gene_type:complete